MRAGGQGRPPFFVASTNLSDLPADCDFKGTDRRHAPFL
jgi:hypothetical protein